MALLRTKKSTGHGAGKGGRSKVPYVSADNTSSSKEGPSRTNIYGSRSSKTDDFHWSAGQTIPLIPNAPPSSNSEMIANLEEDYCHNPFTPSAPDVQSMFLALQNTLDMKFSFLSQKMDVMSEKVTTIEKKQCAIDTELKPHSCPSTPSSSSSITPVRKRLTPVALQSQIRAVHTSFEEDEQFKPHQPITSKHNTEVIKCIEAAIGSDSFSYDLIRKGCKTYKKNLAEKEKQQLTPIKKKKMLRSLKQRSYERRSKAIKGIKEAKYWSDISADMMSEEEKVDDQYVRHPPLYRSERLNKFVDKLDHCLSKCLSDRPRITRVLGSPHQALPPINAKKWTVNHARTLSRRIFDTPDAVCHGYSRINDEEEEEEDQEEEDEQLPGMSSDSEFSAGDSE